MNKIYLNQKGVTFVEIFIVIAILGTFLTLILLIVDPVAAQKKARDNVRITDSATLSRAIEEYISNNTVPPDLDETLRESDTVPTGSLGPVYSATDGWIDQNMSDFLNKLPVDPLNTGTHIYSYQRSGSTYEINMVMEYYTETMTDDDGDNSGVYELGTDLTIIN